MAVTAARCASGRTSPRTTPSTVREPWTVSTVTMLAATPQPNAAAKAMAAKPSRADFSSSWSAPLPSPSLSAPRIVSGPVQKTSDAMTKPSTKRARSAEPLLPTSRACSQPPRRSTPVSRPRRDPAIPPTSTAPSTTSRGAASPTSAARAGERTAIADVAAISSVTRPRPSVTRSRVRTGSRLPSSAPRLQPRSTVTTLTRVPVPMNRAASERDGGPWPRKVKTGQGRCCRRPCRA